MDERERGVPARPLLTTVEAAAYCAFRNPSALRKAHLEGRVFPVGKRGGRGTWMWAIEDLNRFLRGELPGTIEEERSGRASNEVTKMSTKKDWKL
jgi:hypothetical protein